MNVPTYVVQIAGAEDVPKDAIIEMFRGTRPPGDAGRNLPLKTDACISGGEISHKIHLGIRVRVRKLVGPPERLYYQDWPWHLVLRFSTAANTPVRLSNSIGVMDAGYRGEVIAIVDNVGDHALVLKSGHAYFQMVLPDGTPMNLPHCQIVLVRDFDDSDLGSTDCV